ADVGTGREGRARRGARGGRRGGGRLGGPAEEVGVRARGVERLAGRAVPVVVGDACVGEVDGDALDGEARASARETRRDDERGGVLGDEARELVACSCERDGEGRGDETFGTVPRGG